jgi:hypothetical protein
MSERREPGFNIDQLNDPVPTLEPSAPTKTQSKPKALRVSEAPVPARGNGLLVGLVVVSLAATAAIGFLNYKMQQKLDQQSSLIEQMNLWLESTDANLAKTSTTASQSGETLQSRMEQVSQRLEDRIKHFDSEIAKLWTVSYQRNKPQLEEQGKLLDAQTSKLDKLAATVEVQSKELQKQIATVGGIQTASDTAAKDAKEALNKASGVDKQLKTLSDSLAKLSKANSALQKQLTQLSSDTEFQLSIERDERAKLADRIQKGGDTLPIERRLVTIEERLASIDSSRKTVNDELLKVKQQVNTLLLEGAIR